MTQDIKLLTEAEARDLCVCGGDAIIAYLRERGLIAEEPVDPLLVEARELCAQACNAPSAAYMYRSGETDNAPFMKSILAALRRGMELAPRKELTREVVQVALKDIGYVWPDLAVTRLHAALTEALQ